MVPEAPLPPSTAHTAELVPPLEGEVVVDAEPEAFGEGSIDLSLLPLYPNHNSRYIWDREVALVEFILFNLSLF